jgi:hypothetical protein
MLDQLLPLVFHKFVYLDVDLVASCLIPLFQGAVNLFLHFLVNFEDLNALLVFETLQFVF